MILLAHIFKKLIRNWNKRPLNEKDFYRLCKKLGVFVIETDSPNLISKGIYLVVRDIPTIFLDSRMHGMERLWTMFHELGHHILHSPETCFFSETTEHKAQSEANLFAAIALMPEKLVRQIPLWEFYELDEYSAKLFQIRLEVFEMYNL